MAVITHRLDLALRLIDTATGRTVEERERVLRRDGARCYPLDKGDGLLAFADTGREDFTLEIAVRGYEPRLLRVEYGALDPAAPLLELHLIPGPGYRGRWPCLRLEGVLPGITALDAVLPEGADNLAVRFDPRRRLLTVLNPHRLPMDRVWYALVDPARGSYEVFRVLGETQEGALRLDRTLEGGVKNNFPVCPLVFGMAEPTGAYRLRVRDGGTAVRWLVRWQADGAVRFGTVDLRGGSARLPRADAEEGEPR